MIFFFTFRKDYRIDFVISGYQSALSSCTNGIMAEELFSNPDTEDDEDEEEEDTSSASPLSDPTAVNGGGATRDLDVEVTAVLDVLPDLGTGFIRRLLVRYENSEQAIAAILDDNLPPDLAQVDRQELYVPPDPQDKLQRQTGVRHYNVHDGDRYDVLTQDKPECIIKLGKGFPGAPRNAEQMLDDKRDLEQLKDRYQQYALVEESPLENGEYDDEYDDSYEALNDGQAPPVSLLRARLQAASGSAYEPQDVAEDDEESSGSESDAEPAKRNPIDFCENPEITRARYQQRQMAKYGNRGGGGGGSGGGGSGSGASVVGAPKGQGQSQQTQRNRGQKEAHKSSRANHNRKAGAAFKRSKGMMG